MQANIVMLGPPGAGKGTQATHLRRRWRIPHISTGAMLREAAREGTPLGRQAEGVIAQGGLIDDALMCGLVEARLRLPDTAGGFLLDGFPRTIPQAEWLDRFMGDRVLVVVEIALGDADVLKRLASRMVCTGCGINQQDDEGGFATCHACGGGLAPRADDREQVVRHRLEVYRKQTAPLVSYYEARPTFCRANGAQLFDRVSADIVRAVQGVLGVKALPEAPRGKRVDT